MKLNLLATVLAASVISSLAGRIALKGYTINTLTDSHIREQDVSHIASLNDFGVSQQSHDENKHLQVLVEVDSAHANRDSIQSLSKRMNCYENNGVYVPDNSFIMLCPQSSLEALAVQPEVNFVHRHIHGAKLSESLATPFFGLASMSADEQSKVLKNLRLTGDVADLNVLLYPGVPNSQSNLDLVSRALQHHFPGQSITVRNFDLHLQVSCDSSIAPAVAANLVNFEEVYYVDRAVPSIVKNDDAIYGLSHGGTRATRNIGNIMHTRNITGQGILILEGDSGLDYTNCLFHDPAVTLNLCKECNSTVADLANCNLAAPECTRLNSHRKIAGYRLFDGAADGLPDSITAGHGTHVGGTLAGFAAGAYATNNPDINSFAGHAPSARLLVWQGSGSKSSSLAVPSVPYLSWGYDLGAHISSNSWNGNVPNPYPPYSGSNEVVDTLAYSAEDLLILFAAGNEGQDPNYVPNKGWGSLGTQSAAKNVMNIGSGHFPSAHYTSDLGKRALCGVKSMTLVSNVCQNKVTLDCNTFNGFLTNNAPAQFTCPMNLNQYYCNLLLSTSDLTEYCCAMAQRTLVDTNTTLARLVALATDQNFGTGSNNCCPSSFDVSSYSDSRYTYDSLASYSSRGPTMDGRFGVTLIAPGDETHSANSDADLTSNQCDANPLSPRTAITTMPGTSMATPAVSGTAALVEQYFREGFHVCGRKQPLKGHNATSALMKATLINAAKKMDGSLLLGGESTWTALTSLPEYNKTTATGFGVLRLNSTIRFESDPLDLSFIDLRHAKGFNRSGCTMEFEVQVAASTAPFQATLVWTDYQASAPAATALVNDLDLTVIAPSASGPQTFRGNQQFGINGADRSNNAEKVVLNNPYPGTYRIKVESFRVVQPQGFALVVSRPLSAPFAAPSACSDSTRQSFITLCPVSNTCNLSLPVCITAASGGSGTASASATGTSAGISTSSASATGTWTGSAAPSSTGASRTASGTGMPPSSSGSATGTAGPARTSSALFHSLSPFNLFAWLCAILVFLRI